MGWGSDEISPLVAAGIAAGQAPEEIAQAFAQFLVSLPAPDRIALARELLEGTEYDVYSQDDLINMMRDD